MAPKPKCRGALNARPIINHKGVKIFMVERAPRVAMQFWFSLFPGATRENDDEMPVPHIDVRALPGPALVEARLPDTSSPSWNQEWIAALLAERQSMIERFKVCIDAGVDLAALARANDEVQLARSKVEAWQRLQLPDDDLPF